MADKRPVLFCSDDSAAGMADAKAYIARFKLSPAEVALVQRGGLTLIFARRDVRDKLVD